MRNLERGTLGETFGGPLEPPGALGLAPLEASGKPLKPSGALSGLRRNLCRNHCIFLSKVARPTISSRREGGNMDDLRSLRTKVDGKKHPFWRSTNQPVPESPPEPLQCEHCLGNYRLISDM